MEKKLGFSMEKNLFGFGPSLVVSKNAPVLVFGSPFVGKQYIVDEGSFCSA